MKTPANTPSVIRVRPTIIRPFSLSGKWYILKSDAATTETEGNGPIKYDDNSPTQFWWTFFLLDSSPDISADMSFIFLPKEFRQYTLVFTFLYAAALLDAPYTWNRYAINLDPEIKTTSSQFKYSAKNPDISNTEVLRVIKPTRYPSDAYYLRAIRVAIEKLVVPFDIGGNVEYPGPFVNTGVTLATSGKVVPNG